MKHYNNYSYFNSENNDTYNNDISKDNNIKYKKMHRYFIGEAICKKKIYKR